ncbi:hypothetical protein [Metabacillus fastidiosus]|uniref:hypothetical protein n=1 Tax=Metabacillus fastidiosus TaxID=1458 RepID=UPI003D28709D
MIKKDDKEPLDLLEQALFEYEDRLNKNVDFFKKGGKLFQSHTTRQEGFLHPSSKEEGLFQFSIFNEKRLALEI